MLYLQFCLDRVRRVTRHCLYGHQRLPAQDRRLSSSNLFAILCRRCLGSYDHGQSIPISLLNPHLRHVVDHSHYLHFVIAPSFDNELISAWRGFPRSEGLFVDVRSTTASFGLENQSPLAAHSPHLNICAIEATIRVLLRRGRKYTIYEWCFVILCEVTS